MLNIISNLGENAKLEEIGGFNKVVAWYLHDAFKKLGYPSRLVADRNNNIPIADNTLVISAIAMVRMRSEPRYRAMVRGATRHKITLYLDSDFGDMGYPYNIVFTVVPPFRTGRFVYAGWGADPTHCYPEQGEKAVFLDRLGKARGTGIPAERARIYRQYLEVLPTTGAKIYRYDLILMGIARPWVKFQELLRKCHYYCCIQYGESGLSRIEAATCGALLVVPAPLYKPRTMGPLAHAIWRNNAELRKIIATKTDPKTISIQARKQTWDLAARRIMARLS